MLHRAEPSRLAFGACAAGARAKKCQRFSVRRFGWIAELMGDVVRRAAGRRDAVEEVSFVVDVLQCEYHWDEHLVAEVKSVLANRLAIRGVADHDDWHVRAQ